jgi:hypothetical protein
MHASVVSVNDMFQLAAAAIPVPQPGPGPGRAAPWMKASPHGSAAARRRPKSSGGSQRSVVRR